jgi:hypothetical protein
MKYIKITGLVLEVLVSIILVGFLLMRIYFIDTESDLVNDKWIAQLPECPCEVPDKKLVGDGWAVDIGDIKKHHKGASICFRSYPAIKTDQGMSGQQCCYDSEGQLITTGKGAGTPDRETSCAGEGNDGRMKVAFPGVIFHYFKDVLPGPRVSDKTYLKKWRPSLGDCD